MWQELPTGNSTLTLASCHGREEDLVSRLLPLTEKAQDGDDTGAKPHNTRVRECAPPCPVLGGHSTQRSGTHRGGTCGVHRQPEMQPVSSRAWGMCVSLLHHLHSLTCSCLSCTLIILPVYPASGWVTPSHQDDFLLTLGPALIQGGVSQAQKQSHLGTHMLAGTGAAGTGDAVSGAGGYWPTWSRHGREVGEGRSCLAELRAGHGGGSGPLPSHTAVPFLPPEGAEAAWMVPEGCSI